jgi:hypothetical protein
MSLGVREDTEETEESADVAVTDGRRPSAAAWGSLGTSLGLLVVAWGAAIATFPLNDNSFFTHLATGRLILDRGSIPTADPYTFTAEGVDWTVQSWLPSIVYAAAERLGGDVGLRAVVLLLFVVAAALTWRLSRPAVSIIPRLAVVSGAMIVFTGLWSERPYMIGVIGLAVVWLALHGAVRPWLLVPLLWLWANSHGSFVLATVLVVSVIAGGALDRRRHRTAVAGGSPTTELSVLKATLIGTLLAAVGPLGFDVLLFPLKAVSQSEVLAQIVEWQPPAYRSLSERMFLVLVLATFAALARTGSWRLAVPALVFSGAALYAQRNVVMATVVLVPVLAASVPTVGTLTSRARPRIGAVLGVMCAAMVTLLAVAALTSPLVAFDGYPAAALAWLEGRGSGRTAHDVATGNLLEILDGAEAAVFIDDRADMFPSEVFGDLVDLLEGDPSWQAILDRHEIGTVVWERSRPLASLVATSDRWKIVFSDGEWIVACRRGPACEALLS